MATTKKTTVNKTASAKKAPVKRATAKSVATAAPKMRSFRVSPNSPTFTTFKITRQTFYWVIIISLIIFMQLWILSLQLETSMFIEDQMNELSNEV